MVRKVCDDGSEVDQHQLRTFRGESLQNQFSYARKVLKPKLCVVCGKEICIMWAP